jgi:hypothetical protein
MFNHGSIAAQLQVSTSGSATLVGLIDAAFSALKVQACTLGDDAATQPPITLSSPSNRHGVGVTPTQGIGQFSTSYRLNHA